MARALALGARGREFESHHPDTNLSYVPAMIVSVAREYVWPTETKK